ncbi:MAG: hypothetical protein NVS2B7_16440 [Herpetosiphon sp.]
MDRPNNLRVHPGVVRFVEKARALCNLVETDVADQASWMSQTLVAIADLYAAAHYLPVPDIEPASGYADDRFVLTKAEYQKAFQHLGSILGDKRFYSSYVDVTRLPGVPELPAVGDLADDLADIYGDIKPGLRAWDENDDNFLADIIFDWKEPLFARHWGCHSVDALRALHSLVYI